MPVPVGLAGGMKERLEEQPVQRSIDGDASGRHLLQHGVRLAVRTQATTRLQQRAEDDLVRLHSQQNQATQRTDDGTTGIVR